MVVSFFSGYRVDLHLALVGVMASEASGGGWVSEKKQINRRSYNEEKRTSVGGQSSFERNDDR